MEVRSCRGCGKLYNYLGPSTPACPTCMKAMEEKFQVCKQFIRDNPGSGIQEVSDATEVSVKMIKQWVREERLTFAEGSSVGLECESCGANILTGRYCAKCKSKVQSELQQISKPPKPEPEPAPGPRDSAKMRFLDT